MYWPKAVLSPEVTAFNVESLGRVVRSPRSDVAWLEPHRYCWVPAAAKVTSSDASPPEDRATNVAAAGHVVPTWTGAIRGTVPEAEIIGVAAHVCIFCRGPPEDTGLKGIMCARDEAVARLVCATVEEFTADLPLADKVIEFMSWKEHGCSSTQSLMTGVVPGDLKRLSLTVRAASSRGPCEAQAIGGGHDPDWGRCLRPKESIGSLRSCNCRCVIGGRPYMHSCGVIPPSVRRLGG